MLSFSSSVNFKRQIPCTTKFHPGVELTVHASRFDISINIICGCRKHFICLCMICNSSKFPKYFQEQTNHQRFCSGAVEIGGPQDEAGVLWWVAEGRCQVQTFVLVFENYCADHYLKPSSFQCANYSEDYCDFNFLHQTASYLGLNSDMKIEKQRQWVIISFRKLIKERDGSKFVPELERFWDQHAAHLRKAAWRSQFLWCNPRLWRGSGGGSQVWKRN